MRPTSAMPDFYYFCFAVYEPFLTVIGFIGALMLVLLIISLFFSLRELTPQCGNHSDPQGTHNSQAPWLNNDPPPAKLPTATLVTIVQLGHVCALVGLVNLFVLTAARSHLHDNLPLQEKMVLALLTPLLIGDLLHLYITLWALDDQRWEFWNWSPMLWTTIVLGLTLMIPRITWHLGVGRYVHTRDGVAQKK